MSNDLVMATEIGISVEAVHRLQAWLSRNKYVICVNTMECLGKASHVAAVGIVPGSQGKPTIVCSKCITTICDCCHTACAALYIPETVDDVHEHVCFQCYQSPDTCVHSGDFDATRGKVYSEEEFEYE